MTDLKSRTLFFQKMEMAVQALKFAKKFIKEDNVDNEIFDRVIEMKEEVKEL